VLQLQAAAVAYVVVGVSSGVLTLAFVRAVKGVDLTPVWHKEGKCKPADKQQKRPLDSSSSSSSHETGTS
jgi:hypothetical protein